MSNTTRALRLVERDGAAAVLRAVNFNIRVNHSLYAFASSTKNLPADASRNETVHITLRFFELQEPAVERAMAGGGAVGVLQASSHWRGTNAGRAGSAAIVLQPVKARVEGAYSMIGIHLSPSRLSARDCGRLVPVPSGTALQCAASALRWLALSAGGVPRVR